MKALEFKEMETVNGGDCAGSIGFAAIAIGGLVMTALFPPAGILAAMGAGALAGLGAGAGAANAAIECLLE